MPECQFPSKADTHTQDVTTWQQIRQTQGEGQTGRIIQAQIEQNNPAPVEKK